MITKVSSGKLTPDKLQKYIGEGVKKFENVTVIGDINSVPLADTVWEECDLHEARMDETLVNKGTIFIGTCLPLSFLKNPFFDEAEIKSMPGHQCNMWLEISRRARNLAVKC